jgi:thiol-disulfide isomerase/thioredoxin
MTATARRLFTAVALVLAAASCDSTSPKPEVRPDQQRAPVLKVETVAAPADGDVRTIVKSEAARAKGEGRRLLVYVGASWCEPCQRFHQAAAAGKLDEAFPGLRLLEFDLDRDRERLLQAGYTSKLIPLFAVPNEDGGSSGQQIEGGIKGDGAVDHITPRLKALLAKR